MGRDPTREGWPKAQRVEPAVRRCAYLDVAHEANTARRMQKTSPSKARLGGARRAGVTRGGGVRGGAAASAPIHAVERVEVYASRGENVKVVAAGKEVVHKAEQDARNVEEGEDEGDDVEHVCP